MGIKWTAQNTNNASIIYALFTRLSTTFWYLFIFHRQIYSNRLRLWARWPILFRGPTRETAKTNAFKKHREDMKQMKVIGPEEILAVGEACVAIFWHTPGVKGRICVGSGSWTKGTLNSMSTMLHCGLWWQSWPSFQSWETCDVEWEMTMDALMDHGKDVGDNLYLGLWWSQK